MRAEDLFEAMGGIDEKLIARSDRRVRSSQSRPSSGKAVKRAKKRKGRRSVGAEIYRFTVVAMSTAVVVFLLFMARDLLGIRNLSDVRDRLDSTQMSSIAEPAQADDSAAEQPEVSSEMRAADGGQAEEAAESEAADRAAGVDNSVKTAVDMLGELKGDYIRLEYISAEDEANGGSRKVPEYTEEGEIALSEAFSKGKATPAIMVSTGKATYYVYLTRENGEVHRAVFYENAYVSMDNIPGIVMKISQADYEEIENLFR
ncbi:MAG: hypothetical protein IJX83_02260 [Lachnospiraceae bacterium]|nr:hypothetical protein [Lachnospiraceae bacterium]